ncbi:MAG TPA: hypothetical protein VIM11_05710 [Tepidisphaeraceae bacterium]
MVLAAAVASAVGDGVMYPMFRAANPRGGVRASSSATPPSSATTPGQMRHFYGVDAVNFGGVIGDGRGQTIAIVDPFDDPNALSDLQHFDSFYNLPDPPSFKQFSQSGQLLKESGGTARAPSKPTPGPSSWVVEITLDIQWAHVMAPAASIVLVEAGSASFTNMFQAVSSAAAMPNVACVSMSWGSNGEFSSESSNDSTFTAAGVTYLAATGDSGAALTSYPAASPNVVAVGGTTMHFAAGTTNGTYGSETAWSGTGGQLSPYELKPSYQNAVIPGSARGTPDVSMEADPATGVAIYDSYDFGNSAPWAQYGGTSLATPMWAGLIAIIDQGRAGASLSPLSGRNQLLPALYSASATNFHDVTSGSNGSGNNAGVGYDTVTGIGTPKSATLLNVLAGVAASNQLAFTQPPAATVAGVAINNNIGGVKITVQDSLGNTLSGDSSTVTLTLNGGTFAGGGTTATTNAVNGIATFASLVINAAGSYTLTATDGSLTPLTSASFSITSAASNKLVFIGGPSDTTAGIAVSPHVVIDVQDSFGNIVTIDNSSVTMTVATGPGSLTGTTTVQAVSGVATFSNLLLDTAGTYSIQPTDGPLPSTASPTFIVHAASAAKLAFGQQPANTTTGNALSPAITVDVDDAFGNIVTTAASTVTLTLNTGTFSTGSATASAVVSGGVATFSTLTINNTGGYTLTATDDVLIPATSNPFSVTLIDVLTASTANAITLTQDPDGQHIDWIQGSSIGVIPINDPNGLTINGDAGNDSITLDYTNGNPFPNTLHLNGTFTIAGLQGANPLANTALEIGQSTVYFNYASGTSPVSAIQAALAVGYNGGGWNGSAAGLIGAITSATAAGGPANTFGLGFADSADGIVAGQTSNTVEIRYTVMGDANLDRVVDVNDSLLMARHWIALGNPGWDIGNFNYDNTVNLNDATLLTKNWNATASGAVAIAAAATLAAATTPTQAAVPPASTTPSVTVPARSDKAEKREQTHYRGVSQSTSLQLIASTDSRQRRVG